MQIAKHAGAFVIGTAGPGDQAFLAELGVDQPIDYTRTNVADEVTGIDVVLDLVGGAVGIASLPVLRDGGLLISVPSAADLPPLRAAAAGRVRVTGILVEPDRTGMDALAALAAAGQLRQRIAGTLPLDQAAHADELGESGRAGGKLILIPDRVLGFAYRDRGIWRTGILVIAAYFVFAGSVLGLACAEPHATGAAILAGLAVAAVSAACPVRGRHRDADNSEPDPSSPGPAERAPRGQIRGGQIRGTPARMPADGHCPRTARTPMAGPAQSRPGQQSLLAGWPVNRLWVLGVAASLTVAAIDAALGNRAVLIGLLIVGPCCVILTGHWVPTALTGVWVTGLAVALGFPDGIWGTAIFFIWFGAVPRSHWPVPTPRRSSRHSAACARAEHPGNGTLMR